MKWFWKFLYKKFHLNAVHPWWIQLHKLQCANHQTNLYAAQMEFPHSQWQWYRCTPLNCYPTGFYENKKKMKLNFNEDSQNYSAIRERQLPPSLSSWARLCAFMSMAAWKILEDETKGQESSVSFLGNHISTVKTHCFTTLLHGPMSVKRCKGWLFEKILLISGIKFQVHIREILFKQKWSYSFFNK